MSSTINNGEIVAVVLHGRRYNLGQELIVIQPGQRATLTVIVNTAFSGQRAGTLRVESNAANKPVFRLSLDSTV